MSFRRDRARRGAARGVFIGALALSSAGAALPALAHGISEADKLRMLHGGYAQYVKLGAMHMLTGYDHLLFLFGVVFFLSRFRDILKLVTAFTLGHSITLVFATLAGFSINYYLIDAVIALTVVYKGFDNNDGFRRYLSSQPPSLTWMIFAFGLIHGLGLATRLQQLPLGDEGLALRILSFNVGVELGQLAALGAMLVLLAKWRPTESFRKFSFASNNLLMVAGAGLFLVQMHGAIHMMEAGNLGFNYDAHHHHHEMMEQWRIRDEQAARAAGAASSDANIGSEASARAARTESP